ncbi:MAG: hypothetical protein KUG77_07355 [Nannocystaceae bacterium]|nr:hypothetical protein [Nannocystaceae bacterium]
MTIDVSNPKRPSQATQPAPDIIGQARGASRWMSILGLYDLVVALAVVLLAALCLTAGPAALILLPFAFVGLAFFSYRAYHQLGAARLVRMGIERTDGAAFASGFAHLRKILVVTFVLNLGAIIFGGVQ